MKLLLSTLFLTASIGFAPSAFAVDNSISPLCDGSSSGYNRAGGYCEQIASNKSIAPTGRGDVRPWWCQAEPRTCPVA